ncbi:MAG: hypothetical protein ACFB13_17035 [Kiloniellaceae bacterium]
MRIPSAIFTILSLALLLTACARTLPVYNVTEAPVVTGSGTTPSLNQVEDAIVKACRDKEWFADPVADGHIVAKVRVRKHTAVVDILYSPTNYSITYKDSEMLLYDGTLIHRNYNKWVQLLADRIDQELNSL